MGTKERLEKEHAGVPKRKMKLTPEQKAKIDEIGEERDKAMDARIEELTRKLKDVSDAFLPWERRPTPFFTIAITAVRPGGTSRCKR
jgi:hypothetical protein